MRRPPGYVHRPNTRRASRPLACTKTDLLHDIESSVASPYLGAGGIPRADLPHAVISEQYCSPFLMRPSGDQAPTKTCQILQISNDQPVSAAAITPILDAGEGCRS